jgi:hypothetical protein
MPPGHWLASRWPRLRPSRARWWRTLAIKAPQSFPSLQAAAHRLAATFAARQRSLRDPVPGQWVMLAVRLAADLARDPVRCLVHTDLHYGNILATGRPGQPWVAIDPAAAVGAPERSVAELLWTRADELPGPQAITGLLATIVESGQLDPAKAVAWGLRPVRRLLAVGTRQRAHQRHAPVPPDSQRAGAGGRPDQPVAQALSNTGCHAPFRDHQPACGAMAQIHWQTSAATYKALAIETSHRRSTCRWLRSDGTGRCRPTRPPSQQESFRVLRPGGSLGLIDILAEYPVPSVRSLRSPESARITHLSWMSLAVPARCW